MARTHPWEIPSSHPPLGTPSHPTLSLPGQVKGVPKDKGKRGDGEDWGHWISPKVPLPGEGVPSTPQHLPPYLPDPASQPGKVGSLTPQKPRFLKVARIRGDHVMPNQPGGGGGGGGAHPLLTPLA